MSFEKGKSGNPSGRPAKSQQQKDFEYKCRNWASLYAFDKLKKLTESEDDKAVQWATKEMLDRAFGKSVETNVIEANVTATTGSSIEALEGELTAIVGTAEIKSLGDSSADKVDAGK